MIATRAQVSLHAITAARLATFLVIAQSSVILMAAVVVVAAAVVPAWPATIATRADIWLVIVLMDSPSLATHVERVAISAEIVTGNLAR